MADTKSKSQLDFEALGAGAFVTETRNLISIAGSNIYQYSAGGSTPTPSSIQLTAVVTSFLASSPVYQWQYLNTSNVWTNIANATSANFTLAHDSNIWPANATSLRIRCSSRGYSAEILMIKTFAADASTFYEIFVSSPVITKQSPDAATTGIYSSITVQGRKYVGSQPVENFGYVTITKNGDTEAAVATNTGTNPFTFTPDSTSQASSYTINLYDSSNKTTKLDTQSIPVVFTGTAGAAPSYVIVTGEQVFKFLSGQSVPTVQNIVLSAQLYGALTSYTWEYYNGTAWTSLSGTNNQQTYTLNYANAAWSSNTNNILRVRCKSGNYTDETTIVKLYDGSSGITVILSNETQTLTASSTGVVEQSNYIDTTTTVRVFEGATELQYYTGAPQNITAGNWYISNTQGNNIDFGQVSIDTTEGQKGAITTAASNMLETAETAQITWTISGKSSSGTDFTINKTQNFSKSKQGITGTASTIYYLVVGTNAVKQSIAGIFTPSQLNIKAYSVVGNQTPELYSGRFKIYRNDALVETSSANENSKTYTITNGTTSIKVELYLAGGTTTLLDTEIVTVITDGATGSSGIVVDLSNDSHVFTANTDGTIPTTNYTTSGTIIRVFEGASELTYTTGTLSNGTWTISTNTAATNITRGNISAVSGQKYAQAAAASSMTADTANIDWVITGQSGNGTVFTITKTQTFSKSKSGSTGAASVIKYITLNADSIKINTQTIYSPATITATAKQVSGTGLPTNFNGRFKVYEDNVELTGLTSNSDTATITWTPLSQNVKQLKFELYDAGGFTTLLDTETVPVLSSGVVGTLTNDSHVLAADSDGLVVSYDSAVTNAVIYSDNIDDSQNWGFYISGLSNCSYRDNIDTANRTDIGFVSGSFGGQNLLTYSQDFSNATWTKESGFGTITSNFGIAPDGTQTSTRLVYTSGYIYRRLTTAPAITQMTPGTTVTFSCWVKGTAQPGKGIAIWSYNSNGIVATSTQEINPNTWTRCTVTYTVPQTGGDFALNLAGAATTQFKGTIEVWGAQLNTGTVALGYTPTAATAKNSQRGYLKITELTQDNGYVDISAYNVPTNQTITQRFSLSKSKTGRPAIQIALSNDNHIFTANFAGTVSTYTGSGTEIRVYEGANQLSYLGTGTSFTSSDLGRWRISAVTASGITQSINNLSSQTSNNINYAVISAASGMTDATDTANITYTIVGKNFAGQDFTRTAVQRFSKSKSGQRASVANEIANKTAWSDADANAYFTTNYGGVKVVGDRITMYDNATAFVATKFWNGSNWVAATATIDGNLLITGTITGNKLATNTITSNKLLVTGKGVALNDDPNMMDSSAWTTTGSGTSPTIEFVSITDGISGTTAARGSGGVHLQSRAFAVDSTKKYRVRCKVRRSSNATGLFYLRLYRYNSAGSEIAISAGIETITLDNTDWKTFTSDVISVESTAVLAKVAVVLNWNTTTGHMEVQDVRCEQDSADLIVDGSISATKLILGGSNASIFSDIGFQDVLSWGGSAWGGTPASIKAVTDAVIGKNVAFNPAGTSHYTIGWRASTRPVGWIPIDRTKQYRLRVRYRAPNGNGGKRYIGLTQCTETGALVGGNNGHDWYTESAVSTTNTSWALHESIVGFGTDYAFNANTRFVSPAFLFNWNDQAQATNTGEIQVSGFEFEELVTGSLVVNGSITANKIDTRGLEIRDANNNVIFSSGVKLAPEYADPILSTIGQNLIPNSEQTQTPCFGGLWNPNNAVLQAFNIYANSVWGVDTYALSGITTRNIYSRQDGVLSGGADVIAFDTYPTGGWGRDYGIPVVAGRKYIYSCYVASHRCKFQIGFAFWDAAANQLGSILTSPVQLKTDGYANSLAEYRRPFVTATAPAGAVTVSMFLRKYNSDSGTDSYIWYAAPMLEQVNTSQTEPSPYQPGPPVSTRQLGYSGDLDATKGATLGTNVSGQITTGNIANLIATGAISGTYIADATIGTAKIANLAVDNAKIADAAVTNAKIGSLSVSTLKIASNAVTVPIAVTGGAYSGEGIVIKHVFDPDLPEGIETCKGVVLWQATTGSTRNCNWYAYMLSGNRDPARSEGYWPAVGGRYIYKVLYYTPPVCEYDTYSGIWYCYGNDPVYGYADVGVGNGTHNYYSANQLDPYIGWNRAGGAFQDAPVILGIGDLKRGTNTVVVYWEFGGGQILTQRLTILGAKR